MELVVKIIYFMKNLCIKCEKEEIFWKELGCTEYRPTEFAKHKSQMYSTFIFVFFHALKERKLSESIVCFI